MKRRILGVILTTLIVFLSSVSTYAGYDVCNREEDDKQVYGVEQSGWTYNDEVYYTENEAVDIALIFVVKNLQYSDGMWSLDTEVDRIYPIYDFDSNIQSYAICFKTDGLESGYVIISAKQDHMPIMEYAFSGEPVFEEQLEEKELKIFRSYDNGIRTDYDLVRNHLVMNTIFEYYLMQRGRFFDLLDKIIDINKIARYIIKGSTNAISENARLKGLLAESQAIYKSYPGQEDGYVINDRIKYLSSRYGSYTCNSSKVLPYFNGFLTSSFKGQNNCSLVAIATVANWLRTRTNRYNNIPSSVQDIYDDVYSVAINNGYTESGGTNWFELSTIVERAFKKWGYNITSHNRLASLFEVCKQFLNDLNMPSLFSILTGYYGDHTVTVFGYYEYDVALFLAVKDGWKTATRYIHYEELGMARGLTTIDA